MTLAVDVQDAPERLLQGVAHRGDYKLISTAFERLAARLAPAGPTVPAGPMIGVYYDDPMATPEPERRAFAGVVVAPDAPEDPELSRIAIAGGRYAVTVHLGPYAELERTYAAFYGEWLPASGHEPADHPAFELYLNDPRLTPPAELKTAIHMPIAP